MRMLVAAVSLLSISLNALAQPWVGDNAYCYALADGGDQLLSIRKDGTNPAAIGGAAGVANIEALAFDPRALTNPNGSSTSCGVLYAANAGQFGWMHLDDSCYSVSPPGGVGSFIPIGSGFGSCQHPTLGTQTVNDVDGMQIDLTTGNLWGTERNGGIDFIFQIDPVTGTVKPNTFPAVGPGLSCVSSANVAPRLDLDDIAIEPNTGDMYVVNNAGGSTDLLLQINPANGSLVRVVGPFGPGNGVFDMEGLSFGILGDILFGTTGSGGAPANSLWSISANTTGRATALGPLSVGSDHEAVACMTDNVITGTVFLDVNQDGVYQPANGDSGYAAATVSLYSDNNGDGLLDAGDTLVETTTTNAAGVYAFSVATANPFVMDIQPATLPGGAFLTTDNLEASDFRPPNFPFLFGNREENNDFGFFSLGDLDIVKTSTPSTPLAAGDPISYQIEITNNTAVRHSGISVSDVLPNGVTYTPGTTVAVGPRPVEVRDNFDANSFSNQDGRNNWSTNWIENANEAANFPGPLQPGNIYISAGFLHLKDNPDTGTQPSVARQVDLSGGLNSAELRLDFQTDSGVDANDNVVVEVSAGGINGAYTVLETFTGLVGVQSGSRSYDISGFISATTAVRFRVSANYGGTNEFFFVDNLQITADDTGSPASLDNGGISSPQLLDGTTPGLVEPGDGFILDPGQTLVVTFDATVDSPPPSGVTQLTNLASVDSIEGLPSTATVVNQLQLPPGVLTVDKSSSGAGSGVTQDQVLTYTLLPRADGPALLSNIQLSDPIPAGTSYVVNSASPTQDSGPSPLLWNLGSNVADVPASNSGTSGTVTANLLNDTYMDENNPDDNFSSSVDMDIENDPGDETRGLVRWDLSNVPSGAVITSATMRFFVNRARNLTINLHRVTTDWDSGTVTWNDSNPPTAWTNPGGDFNTGVEASFTVNESTDQNQYKNVTVPNSLIQSWLDSPSSNFGILLDAAGTGNTERVEISTQNEGAAEQPILEVSYFLAATTTSLRTDRMLVSDGDAFTVTMTLTSTASDPTVTPGALNVAGSGGAGATCGGAMPASQPITANTPIEFTWSCTANAGVSPGQLIFSSNATGTVSSYSTASSNSLLLSPPFTFQVRVDSPLDQNVTRILNTATATSDQTPPATDTTSDPIVRGVIGDRVWLDVDADGVQDVGEPGLANVTVELRDGTCTPGATCPTTVTDASGNYFFAYLPPGSYNVFVNTATLPAGLTASAGTSNPQGPSVIATNESYDAVDFGFTNAGGGTAIIGDRVWSDADNDGLQDNGEAGLPGVTVNLVSAGPDGVFGTADDVVAASTVTGPYGDYLFAGVAPGEYIVDVAAGVPGGYTLSNGPHSNPDPTAPISVIGGDVVTDADFGYFNPATFSISDRIWLDGNGDGSQNGGEPGIGGITVNLLDASGNVVATTVTDPNGDFSFSGLPDGDYTIAINDANGQLNGLGGTTPDAQVNQRSVTVAGADLSGVNFGYNVPGSVGDTLFSDSNGNGVQDPGESGLAGVTVQLWQDANGDGVFDNTVDTLVATRVTGADGTYLFDGLLPGTFFASVDNGQPALAGYAPTTTDQETGGNAPGTQIEASLANLSDSFLDADFGYRNNALPEVSGNVFLDVDADGTREPNGADGVPGNGDDETGFTGVTVNLVSDPDGIPDSGDEVIIATTTSDAAGNYTFTDVAPGDYQVVIGDVNPTLDGYTLTSGLDEVPITVAAADVSGVDFGYVRKSGSGSIGDTVWLDVDPPGAAGPDGVRGPSEPGLSMVTVSLYADLDGDGIAEPGGDDGGPIATAVTDANGQYVFNNLSPGNYFVDVDGTTLPTGLVTTTGTTDPSSVIGLSDAEIYVDADFGYRPAPGTAVIGDRVWYDANGNGLQESSEIGIGGVGVTAVGLGPDGINGTVDDVTFTTTTAADGSYLFTGLAPDSYTVFFDTASLPAGYNTTPTNTGANSTYNVTLAAGDVVTSLDWGFNGGAVGSIGDQVFLDVDGDGVQDAGEAGIPGVTINLVDPVSGTILATTTSNADGSYQFAGLPLNSDYQIQVSDVDRVLVSLNQSTPPPGTLTPTAGTPNITTADFGFAPSNGRGSIGTNIWRDLDADGFRDIGEPPIQGVTVNVWRDLNNNGVIDPGVDNLVRTVATDFNGEYEVKSLLPGRYLVDVTDTAGVLAGMTRTVGTPGVDDNSQSDPYAVTLSPASPNNVTADFGYRDDVATPPASISGTVFLDDDIDGVFDDPLEPTLAGVEVLLFRVLNDGTRALVGRTFTDVNGDYTFSDLPPGNFEVGVVTGGSGADGYQQTTQSATRGVQPVTLAAGQNATDNDFGFFDAGVTTTPVTLSYFEAKAEAGGTTFTWHTATEVGHVGFNLLAASGGEWQQVNERLIASPGTDSIAERRYEYQARGVSADEFMLEDIDINGVARRHGPFEVDQPQGHKSLATQAIDWAGIGEEHADKQAQRSQAARAALKSASKGATASLNLLVDEDGLYRVSFSELEANGFVLSPTAPEISLSSQGAAVPVYIDTQARTIEFVGHALDTLYTRTNVYTVSNSRSGLLQAGATSAAPAAGASAPQSYQETRRIENQRVYSFASPTGDPWFDRELLAFTTPVSTTVSLELDDRQPGDVDLTVGIWGVTDLPEFPDHHVQIDVNGVNLADEFFDGLLENPISVTVPDNVLNGSGNSLQIISPADTGADFDLIHYDYYEVSYPRGFVARNGELVFTDAAQVFEVTALPDPDVRVYRQSGGSLTLLTDVEVSGTPGNYQARFAGSAQATYRVASGPAIRSPQVQPAKAIPDDLLSGNARLLIISHPDFISGLDRLIAARQQQGWTVKVVDVEALYAAYTHGVFDPAAISRYIDLAATALGTEAVLLVGGDTYDYRNFLGLGGISFMPSIYAETGDIVRFAPADGLYTDRNGDRVPDLAIGRFPVRTSAELDTMIDRTLQFENQSGRKSLLLAADDYDQPSRFDFRQASEQLATLVPQDWQLDRAYIDDLGVSGARAALLQSLNSGVAVTSYEGHSSPEAWSFDGLFNATDASNLSNGGQPTVVTQWGCWTTYYVSPESETMAHKLLLSGNRGAAAVLGATTLTEARSERALGLAIFSRLFEPGATAGQVVLEAKQELAQLGVPAVLDVLVGWNLLGDPTLSGFGSVNAIPRDDDLFSDSFE